MNTKTQNASPVGYFNENQAAIALKKTLTIDEPIEKMFFKKREFNSLPPFSYAIVLSFAFLLFFITLPNKQSIKKYVEKEGWGVNTEDVNRDYMEYLSSQSNNTFEDYLFWKKIKFPLFLCSLIFGFGLVLLFKNSIKLPLLFTKNYLVLNPNDLIRFSEISDVVLNNDNISLNLKSGIKYSISDFENIESIYQQIKNSI
jgi:Ni/Fe-hydrogenase subunit HybB-like protein